MNVQPQRKRQIELINQAIEYCGSNLTFVRKLDIDYATLSAWQKGYEVPAPRWAQKIEDVTDGLVAAIDLRPDWSWDQDRGSFSGDTMKAYFHG